MLGREPLSLPVCDGIMLGREPLSLPKTRESCWEESLSASRSTTRFTVGLVLVPLSHPFHCWAENEARTEGYLHTHHGTREVYPGGICPPPRWYLRTVMRGYEPGGAHCGHTRPVCTQLG